MIIFRLKEIDFSRRDEFPDKLKNEFKYNNEFANKADEVIIKIERTDTFNKQFNLSTTINQKIIKGFIQDFKDENKWFEDPISDAHYLADMSNVTTSINDKRSVVFSKKINNQDRFNYRIYRPELIEDELTGKILYIQKIVLCSCSEHTINGMSGAYVKNQTGNTWHPKKKPSRFKIKLNEKEKNKDKNKKKHK